MDKMMMVNAVNTYGFNKEGERTSYGKDDLNK